jgi:hypothetical protein
MTTNTDKLAAHMVLVHAHSLAFANVCQADEVTVRQRIEAKDVAQQAVEASARALLEAAGRVQQAEPVAWANGDELDNMLDDRVATVAGEKSGQRTVALYLAAPTAQEASKPVQAEAATASNAEQEELRAAQAVAVMPMIGPLLDAWEGLPNDISGDEELLTLKRQMSAISRAMDTAALATQPPAIPAAPAVQASGEREAFDALERRVLNRYHVEKRTGGGFWPYAVRAGDGTQELYIGHKKTCDVVARCLTNACHDGIYMARAALASPPASGEKQA